MQGVQEAALREVPEADGLGCGEPDRDGRIGGNGPGLDGRDGRINDRPAADGGLATNGGSDEQGLDPLDEEVVNQEEAREGSPNSPMHAAAPTLQSPLRVNPLIHGTGALQHTYPLPFSEAVVNFARKTVRIALQLGLILAICFAGEKLSEILPIDIPSNICSMVLLLVFLASGVVRMESIAEAADFLLDHMAVFFIPAAVAIMGSFDVLAGNIAKLVAICLITTVLVFFVTSFTVSTVANLMARRAVRAQAAASASPSTPKTAHEER